LLKFLTQVDKGLQSSDPTEPVLDSPWSIHGYPVGLIGWMVGVLGVLLIIVGVVLHIVAASRRRRIDETLSVIPPLPGYGQPPTLDGNRVR
jgi:hypothetical protein